MKKLFLLLTAAAGITTAQAQINVTSANFTYTQDFNTLDNSTTNSSNLPTGWAIKEVGTSASANNMYRSGAGTSNAGDVYSFGDSASTERALGSVASGTNAPSFGAMFMNTSTDTIGKFVISHKVEQWRAGDTLSKSDTTYFYYSTTADSVGDTVAANWTEVPSLMLHSPTPVSTSPSGNALNGNASGNNYNAMDSVTVTVLPGQHLIIKWVDKNCTGSDDGLAIDDLSIVFKGTGPVSVANTTKIQLPLSILGNATANNMTIGFTAAEAGKYQVEVLDLTGRTLHTESINAVTGAQRYTVNGMNLASGLYIVKLSNANTVGVTKVTIQ
ncbi:MAG: T9SS type A sorting domain-containing protein [Bacteroidetes bacterium]|nr:T9SS type A sorting domain-containing protein [Bacteroidota bacterium]